MTLKMKLISTNLIIIIFICFSIQTLVPAPSGVECTKVRDYYYTRTRKHPSHLRISEELKNKYTDEVKYESKINGTKFEYYRSTLAMNYDELVFETIDAIFRHRLSPFYIHHYDSDQDKKHSSDPRLVSQEACARDLLYLVDKLSSTTSANQQNHHLSQYNQDSYDDDNEHLTPELSAFFDSYARQESGLLMGNTYWVGGYDQCISRHVFELMDSYQHQQQSSSSSSNLDDHSEGAGQRQSQLPEASRSQQQQQQQQHRHHQHQANGGGGQNKQVVSFGGRYCVASLKAPSWDRIIETKKIKQKNYFKSKRQLEEYSKLFRIQLGICLPSSCDSTALEHHHDEIKLLLTSKSLSAESRLRDYDLIDLFCLPDETSQLRQWSSSAVNFILFITLWLTVVLMATFADIFELFPLKQQQRQDNQQQQYLGPKTTKNADESFDESDNGKEHVKKHKRVRASLLPQLVCWFSLRANYRKLMYVSGVRVSINGDHVKSAAKSEGATADDEPAAAARPQASLETRPQQQQENGKQCDQDSVSKSQHELSTASATSTKDSTTTNTTSDAPNTTSTASQAVQLNIDLKFLNACKVMIMFWIINGHIMLLMIQTAKNILNSDAILNELFHFLIGATFGVDLFFVMTGFLTCYLMFNSGHAYKMKLATWLYLSFHRYWRLAPMYLLSFWFSRSVAQYLGSGPLWDYGTSSITFRGLCNTESWWYPLTLTSNLHGLFEECMITSWYISCDMQFWLVSPIFIYLLAKSPLSGWLVSLATIAASSNLRFSALMSNDSSARYDELVQPRADIFMRVSYDTPAIYTHPHYRISAYIIGLLAGHYVYMIKSSKWTSLLTENLAKEQQQQQQRQQLQPQSDPDLTQSDCSLSTSSSSSSLSSAPATSLLSAAAASTWKQLDQSMAMRLTRRRQQQQGAGSAVMSRAQRCSRLRNVIAYTGLAMFLFMAFGSYISSHYFPNSLLKHAKPAAAVFHTVDHLVMSLGASMMLVAVCMGQWPALNRLLSHPNWTRLSKINYALLLLQCEAIYYQIFCYEQVPMAGTREMINILFNLLVTLYPVAFVVTLVFEYPLANIEKLLIG